MNEIRIKCPAKINLTLEIVNRREDGFHNINSIMQLISLYDYLNIKIEPSNKVNIILNGNSKDIPYDENNLVYKSAELFLRKAGIENYKIEIYIEKNIPISAGLAGGSTDAAGTLYGLNELFGKPLNNINIENLCAELGSDLNVCFRGGCLLATSRGENVEELPSEDIQVTLIKPKFLGISAKEAYTKYSKKEFKPKYYMTEKMISALNNHEDIEQFLYNDLEYAVFEDYKELQQIKQKFPKAVMSGSGSTYFILDNVEANLGENFEVINGLKFIKNGVEKA